MCDWDDRKKKEEHHEIVIQDRRHLRGEDDAELTEAEPVAAEPAPPPVAEPDAPGPKAGESAAAAPGEVVEFRQPERRPTADPVVEPEPAPPSSAEEAQLRMLFEMGVTGYLQGQLQLLLTFAVIYLGHQPNPANGLLSTDLEKARLAIDMLDFIVSRTKDEMQPAEYTNLAKLVTELKMDFAQVAQPVPPAAPDPGLGN